MLLKHRQHRRQLIYFVSAWAFLNLFMNINYPAPMVSALDVLLPSLEVWAVLLLLSLLARYSVLFTPRVHLPLLAVLVFLRLFRFGDVLMPLYFNRPFNLYVDSGYVPDLLHLLYHSFSFPQIAVWGLGTSALLALSIWGLFKSIEIVHGCFASTRFRKGFWLLTVGQVLLVGSYLSGNYPRNLPPPGTSITPRLIAEADFIRRLREVKTRGLSAVQMAAARIPRFDMPLKELRGNDVYLFLIESYGYTLFSHPRHTGLFKPIAGRFAATLEKDGFHMVSHCLRSSTFGGASWLAFGTLESGVWVSNQIRYNFLLNSEVQPLAGYFNQAGYRTVSVMPGTTFPWPEGEYFSYVRSYYAKDLNYRGPAFGWSPMPDQFVLDTIYRKEVRQRKQPLFIRYVLISSHAPFHHQPAYIEDWEQIGDGAIYHKAEPVTFPINWPDLTHATDAYLRAVDYELKVLSNYLTRFIEGDSLIIIMGDHQPNAQITGENAPWLVPVHVISRNRSLLEPFKQMGYKPGMTPRNPPPYKGMDTFMSDFLTAFSR